MLFVQKLSVDCTGKNIVLRIATTLLPAGIDKTTWPKPLGVIDKNDPGLIKIIYSRAMHS
jgi:hypothetical protein